MFTPTDCFGWRNAAPRGDSALLAGARFRYLRGRLGPGKAVKAMAAHKNMPNNIIYFEAQTSGSASA